MQTQFCTVFLRHDVDSGGGGAAAAAVVSGIASVFVASFIP